ncbi:hypothetical protein [Pleionea sediminis]|uniref:hypothetical protein n=1 Tax=Pleionea sediminis TaxID=2569479 RepID=UPI001186B476|nr:hypothetical protein [Pleionea sediminis]
MFDETYINLSDLESEYNFERELVVAGKLKAGEEGRFYKAIEKSKNKKNVEAVQIEVDYLKDLTFLKYFKNVDTVLVFEAYLDSLSGVEKLQKLEVLILNFNRDHGCDCSAISDLNLKFLEVKNVGSIEYQLGGGNLRAESITVLKGDFEDLGFLKSTGVKRLDIGDFSVKCLNGIDELELSKLSIRLCKKIERLTFDNDLELDFFEIETCNKLNINSFIGKVRCTELRISSCKGAFDFSQLLGIQGVKKISIENTGVELDYENFGSKGKEIEDVYISPLSSVNRKKMKEIFPNLTC